MMGDAGGSAAAGEEKKASSSSSLGILRVVWFRQMLRRWQSSSSSSSSSSSATGDGAGPNPSVSTDQRSSDGTAPAAAPAHQHEHRSPPLPAAASSERPRSLPRVVVVEERGRKCPAAAEGSGAGSPMTPVTPDSPADVPRGCCPVYVGLERRRFVVPTAYLGMPVFRCLLEKAEEEFEFHYHGGAVTIPCDTEAFKYILLVMDRHRQGLVDDEGNAKKTEDVGEQGGGRPLIVVAGSGSAATISAANAADGAAILKCKPIIHGP